MNPFTNSHIVLAAGKQDRWKPDENVPKVKQLCVIHNETLIDRIARQFPDPIVFTRHPEIQEHFLRCYEPEDNRVTISTLFSTRAHWREWTIILLGDVAYGRKTVKKIKAQSDTLMFYGDDAEIYAIKFHRSMREYVAHCIQNLVCHPSWEDRYGKLWNLYRFMNGINFTEHVIGPRFTKVYDCRDFDTKEEYLKYIK